MKDLAKLTIVIGALVAINAYLSTHQNRPAFVLTQPLREPEAQLSFAPPAWNQPQDVSVSAPGAGHPLVTITREALTRLQQDGVRLDITSRNVRRMAQDQEESP